MIDFSELKALFLEANDNFLKEEAVLINSKVSERALCASLMNHIYMLMRKDSKYDGYYVDVEYNRNQGHIKTITKTIKGLDTKVIINRKL